MNRILLIVVCLALMVGTAWADPVPAVTSDDFIQGAATAPVTVIEYFSLDCPHCARWEAGVFPQVKSELVDTGKVRFVLRDYPLRSDALQAAQLAHCQPDQYMAFVETLLESQTAWVPMKQGVDPVPELNKIAKLGGISDAKFKTCMADTKLADSIVASRHGGDVAGVTGTPYFFFNGKAGQSGEMSFDDFAKLVHAAGG